MAQETLLKHDCINAFVNYSTFPNEFNGYT